MTTSVTGGRNVGGNEGQVQWVKVVVVLSKVRREREGGGGECSCVGAWVCQVQGSITRKATKLGQTACRMPLNPHNT